MKKERGPNKSSLKPTGEQKTFSTLRYPYFVIRWMAAVYSRREIRFCDTGANQVSESGITLVHPAPFHNGQLEPQVIEDLFDAIHAMVRKSGLRMCLVLAGNHAVFFETDGRVWQSFEPPSGGVDIDGRVTISNGPGDH